MDILFALVWLWILFNGQLAFRIPFFHGALELGFVTILVIYVGFRFSFLRGLITVALVSFIAETFTLVPHGFIILAHLILFIGIRLLLDQILSEAYLTKSLWVFLFSFFSRLITGFVFDPEGVFIREGSFWIVSPAQAVLNGILSFPLFIALDASYDLWTRLFSRRRRSLTGADFYQVQSKQRKYF
ncbi:MAG: hypothetical protein HY541_06265 [Deltaproteobacteria bacterium]|nr:hypothetical protein [Deltaproteobacteria bacterium]